MVVLKEFKEFAIKGNVMDLAVAVIIGGAFGKIVTSLVNDVIMPLAGSLTGGVNLTHLHVVIKEARGAVPAVSLNYGSFAQSVVDFVIVAFSIFVFIKLINNIKGVSRNDDAVSEPEQAQDVALLQEIRDLLANQAG
jgi:large conductance mechanosensitive channel